MSKFYPRLYATSMLILVNVKFRSDILMTLVNMSKSKCCRLNNNLKKDSTEALFTNPFTYTASDKKIEHSIT